MSTIRIDKGPEFTCAADDTVLRAGLRAGLGFPYECNAGSCGTCKVELIEGQITSLRPDAPGLAERDRAKNRVLACQARPGTDCTIKVRLREENVPHHRPAKFSATLTGFRDLTHDESYISATSNSWWRSIRKKVSSTGMSRYVRSMPSGWMRPSSRPRVRS